MTERTTFSVDEARQIGAEIGIDAAQADPSEVGPPQRAPALAAGRDCPVNIRNRRQPLAPKSAW
jgi:hypothetical protein